jgi:hypothetical protein
MKKTFFILASIVIGTMIITSFNYASKKTIVDNNGGLFHLNIYNKNNAGWFHLNVLNMNDNSNPDAAPSNTVGYFPISNKTTFAIILPNNKINELTPTYTLFRDNNGAGTPTRGGWSIEFDISCIGSDLIERRITPRYKIESKNYYDQLIKDENGNDGFKIYLIKTFAPTDTTTMLNKNTEEYNTFKSKTGRP